MNNKTSGYVYILSNPSMPGLLKIGMTKRSVEKRVSELSSSSGVPTKFIVEFAAEVRNVAKAEKDIHSTFRKYRVNGKREFFKISTAEAIRIAAKITDRRMYSKNKKMGFGSTSIQVIISFISTFAIWMGVESNTVEIPHVIGTLLDHGYGYIIIWLMIFFSIRSAV